MSKVYDAYLKRLVWKRTRNAASQQCARKRILKVRGSVCEQCGFDGYVELHHIVRAVDGGSFSDDNLILLCTDCHKLAHKPVKEVNPWRVDA